MPLKLFVPKLWLDQDVCDDGGPPMVLPVKLRLPIELLGLVGVPLPAVIVRGRFR